MFFLHYKDRIKNKSWGEKLKLITLQYVERTRITKVFTTGILSGIF